VSVTESAVDDERIESAASTSEPERTTQPTADIRARAARLLVVTAPALVFLGVRAVGLLVLSWLTEVNGGRLLTRLSVWDGQWLLGIARGGYTGVPNGLVDAFGNRDPTTALAFFPGYPATVAVLRFITGMNVELAGLAVCWRTGWPGSASWCPAGLGWPVCCWSRWWRRRRWAWSGA
jgi:hypothetical protein